MEDAGGRWGEERGEERRGEEKKEGRRGCILGIVGNQGGDATHAEGVATRVTHLEKRERKERGTARGGGSGKEKEVEEGVLSEQWKREIRSREIIIAMAKKEEEERAEEEVEEEVGKEDRCRLETSLSFAVPPSSSPSSSLLVITYTKNARKIIKGKYEYSIGVDGEEVHHARGR